MMAASFDVNLDRATYLVNFVITGKLRARPFDDGLRVERL